MKNNKKKKTKTITKPISKTKVTTKALDTKVIEKKSKLTIVKKPLKSIHNRLIRIPMFILVWVILAVCVFTLNRFTAQTGGNYANADALAVTFDYNPKSDVLDKFFQEQNIAVFDNNIDSNVYRFKIKTENNDLGKILSALKNVPGVINSESFKNVNINPVAAAMYSILYIGLVMIGISFLIIFIGLNKEKKIERLKLWAADIVSMIVFILVVVTIGTVISNLKINGNPILTLTPDSWNLLGVLVMSWFVLLTYINIHPDIREAFLGFWFDRETNQK